MGNGYEFNLIHSEVLIPYYINQATKLICTSYMRTLIIHLIRLQDYEFDIFFLELIPDEIKKRVLEEVLDIYVNDERYEEAVEVRDEIQNIV